MGLYLFTSGVVLWNVFMAGTFKSFGVFCVEFLDLYKERPSTTAWIGGVFGITTTILGTCDKFEFDYVRTSTYLKFQIFVFENRPSLIYVFCF